MQTFSVPIRLQLPKGKKVYYLNLNNYRNWQFHVNNTLKQTFKQLVLPELQKLERVEKPCRITYRVFYPTRRLFDLDNMGAVLSKFTNDALVSQEIIEDDNYKCIPEIIYVFGGVDKDNPRCEVTIEELEDEQK